MQHNKKNEYVKPELTITIPSMGEIVNSESPAQNFIDFDKITKRHQALINLINCIWR